MFIDKTNESEILEEITDCLNRWGSGEDPRMESLLPRIYENLCSLARFHLKGDQRGTLLQTQVLVNEVYLQLEARPSFRFENRAHFFALVSKIMRQTLIKFARRKNAQKRGPQLKLSLNTDEEIKDDSENDPTRLIALHEALNCLAQIDPRASQIVELKFFGGMGSREIGKALSISKNTIARDWEFAKRWLSRELGSFTP